jgi:hypothetical protein
LRSWGWFSATQRPLDPSFPPIHVKSNHFGAINSKDFGWVDVIQDPSASLPPKSNIQPHAANQSFFPTNGEDSKGIKCVSKLTEVDPHFGYSGSRPVVEEKKGGRPCLLHANVGGKQ